MTQPTVCCVMLVNGREAMTKRAIKSFRGQTYQKKRLMLFDTGVTYFDQQHFALAFDEGYRLYGMPQTRPRLTVGELRNLANETAINRFGADVVCHLDSDDWSHPRRIEEQVALLQASGMQAIGYSDMLFWETCQHCNEGRANTLPECPYCHLKYDPLREVPAGKAWFYRHPTKPLGTSLMYWRSAWEQRPFPDLPKNSQSSGEDYVWLQGVDHLGVSSFPSDPKAPDYPAVAPRMIASIHGQNTTRYDPPEMERQSEGTSLKRAAEWDSHCRMVMEL